MKNVVRHFEQDGCNTIESIAWWCSSYDRPFAIPIQQSKTSGKAIFHPNCFEPTAKWLVKKIQREFHCELLRMSSCASLWGFQSHGQTFETMKIGSVALSYGKTLWGKHSRQQYEIPKVTLWVFDTRAETSLPRGWSSCLRDQYFGGNLPTLSHWQ